MNAISPFRPAERSVVVLADVVGAAGVSAALRAAADDEVVVVTSGGDPAVYDEVRRASGPVRVLVHGGLAHRGAESLAGRGDVLREATALAEGVVVSVIGSAKDAVAEVSSTEVSSDDAGVRVRFLLHCSDDVDASVLSAVAVVMSAQEHPEWDAELVLAGASSEVQEAVRARVSGDVTTAETASAPDPSTVVVELASGEVPDSRTVGQPQSSQVSEPEHSTSSQPADTGAAGLVVTVVLAATRAGSELRGCLEALAATSTFNRTSFEVVVVDDACQGPERDLLAQLGGDVQVVRNSEAAGLAAARAQGAMLGSAPLIAFVDEDAVVLGDWLDVLVEALKEDSRRAGVQARALTSSGAVVDAGGLVAGDGSLHVYGRGVAHPELPELSVRWAPDVLTGPVSLYRRSALEQVADSTSDGSAPDHVVAVRCLGLLACGWTLLVEPAAAVLSPAAKGVAPQGGGVRGALLVQQFGSLLVGRPQASEVLNPNWALRPQAGQGPGELAPRPGEVTGLRVLVLDPFPPMFDRASGCLRTFELERALRAAGHSVVHEALEAAPERERYARELSRFGVRLHGDDPAAPGVRLAGGRSSTRPGHEHDSFDVVIVGPWECAEAVLPILRSDFPSARVVVDSCDLHFVREARSADRSPEELEDRRRRELGVYAAADHVLVVSEVERQVLRELLPATPASVVGNAHRVAEGSPGVEGRSGALFIGNANHRPNLVAAQWLVDEVWPLVVRTEPTARLVVAGNDPRGELARLAGPSVDVPGWVPSTRPLLDSARVSVAPLLAGAGVKGKVGEALAAGVPVVATSIGAEGLGLLDLQDVRIADDAQGFADHVVTLLRDDRTWRAQQAAGLRRSREGLGPEHLRAGLQGALEQVLQNRAQPSAVEPVQVGGQVPQQPSVGGLVVLLVDDAASPASDMLVAQLEQRSRTLLRASTAPQADASRGAEGGSAPDGAVPDDAVAAVWQRSGGRRLGDEKVSQALGRLVLDRAVDVVLLHGLGGPDHLHPYLAEAARESGAVVVLVLEEHDQLVAGGLPVAAENHPDVPSALVQRSMHAAMAELDVVVGVRPSQVTSAQDAPWSRRTAVAHGPVEQWWPTVEEILDMPTDASWCVSGSIGPQITVVIATYGRPAQLHQALEGLCRQTLDRSAFEVIVVDDGSATPVSDVVARFTDRIDVRCTRLEENSGVGPARNAGLKLARSPIVLFFDDDDRPRPRLLEEHLRHHAAFPALTDVVLGFRGAGAGLTRSNVTYAVSQTVGTYVCYGDLRDGDVLPWHYAWGGLTSYKTALLREHPLLMPWMEDMEHAWRLRAAGLRVVFSRHAAQVFDDVMSIEQYMERSARHGAAQVVIARKHADPQLATHFQLDDLQGRALSLVGQAAPLMEVARQLDGVARSELRATAITLDGGGVVAADEFLDHAYRTVFELVRLDAAIQEINAPGREPVQLTFR